MLTSWRGASAVDIVLFNTHDVVLLVTVFQCVLLAAALFHSRSSQWLSNSLLVGLLLSVAAVPLDTLISFGAAFRSWSIAHLPNWFYVFEVGYWLQGPFLLLYLRSRLYQDYRPRGVEFFYLVPFLLFVFHQILSYHMLPSDVKADIQRGYNIGSETFTIFFVTLAREILRLYFGVLCLLELRQFTLSLDKKLLQAKHGQVQSLHLVVYGFVALWGWSSVIAVFLVINRHFDTHLPAELMGLLANYGTCLFLALVLTALARKADRENEWPRIPIQHPVAPATLDVDPPASAPTVNPEYVRRLEELMHEKKIYLESSLTLEMLATHMSISPRTLSTILNRHYGSNFFEFINTYRIEDAKKLLLQDDHQDATMLDIMYEVGFNSKATFNNFFKKMEGITPREYKKAHVKAVQA